MLVLRRLLDEQNIESAELSVFAVEQRWARNFFGWSANRKSANSWLILQSQIRKFVMINPQMANPQISLVSQSTDANPQISICKEKVSVSDPDPHWFVLIRIYILDYEMPCNESS
jgi:hypothetical protein